MRTAIYNKVKRLAALFIAGCAMTTGVMAQESLHLFYKDGRYQQVEITDSSFVEFVKQPFIENIADYYGDTIYVAANAGRTMGFGWMTSNFPWTATTDANWLTIRQEDFEKSAYSRGGGIKESAYLIFTEANFSDQERTATITFNARGASEQITVVQLPYLLSLSPVGESYGNEAVTEMEEFIAWNSTEFYAVAYPNFSVKLTSYPEWMTLDTITYGGADFTLDKVAQVPDSVQVTYEDLSYNHTYARFYLESNNSPENRSGEIVFEGRGQRAVLTVTQEGLNETTILQAAEELHKQLYSYNVANSNHHDDFGFPAIMLYTDSRGMDMVSMNNGYNWFSSALTYTDMLADRWPTVIYWRTLYNHISTINGIMREMGSKEDDTNIRAYLAQAYALRAFDYFYLAQIYSHTYAGNEEALCVPIMPEEENASEQGVARATTREVYAYIMENLNKAITLLEANTVEYPHKGFISTEAAYALRARINLVMNNWEAAASDVERVVEATTAEPYTIEEVSTPGFSNINDAAWLWGFKVDDTYTPVQTGIINWPSHMCSMTGNGYTTGIGSDKVHKRISKALWNQIPETDVRKGWWIDESMHSPLLVNAYGEESAAQIPYTAYMAPYTNVKFGPDKGELFNPTNAQDIPLIRIEELLFIWAEAQAMMGNTEDAAELLTDFVQECRDPYYTCEATTTEELLEAIWMQRRIELWGEGHSYFDLMRLKKATDRRGAGFQPEYVFNIPDSDAARIYQLPQVVMDRNQQLVQNPEPEMPQPVAEIEFVAYKNGVFTSELFGGSWEQAMEVHLTDKNLYRLPDYISAGYDLLFYWDETTGEVAFAKDVWETGYVHNQHGMIMAYAQSISYDEATKTFTFGVEYWVEAGSFGVKSETFTLRGDSEIPAQLYMIGEQFGGWDWVSDGVVSMTPVHSHEGAFWATRYFTAGSGFKFCSQREWSGDFYSLGNDYGYYSDGSNCYVEADGFYTVYVDFVNNMIAIEPAAVYGIGDCFGSWDTYMESSRFTAEGRTLVSPATVADGNLRMYVAAPSEVGHIDWWQMEFNIYDGIIVYRGAGDDQEFVPVAADQKIVLDVNAGTGDIERNVDWQWFSADAEGNQIVVDTEDEASFINFAEGWWEEYFYDVRIKFFEEDGLRHCVAYREDGIWGEGMGIEFHFTMATEPNEMGEYDIDVPRQYMGWEYADTASVYFYDWYNYVITDGGYADTTWVDANDFYAKNGANYPRSYSDGKGGFYFNMKYYVPAAGGGWTPDNFDVVATIQGTYQEACEMALNFKYVYDGKALVDVRMISYVEYVKYVCVKGALSNNEIAQYADSLRNDVNNTFNVLHSYDVRELKLPMEEYGTYTFIAVPFDASGTPRRPEIGKLCQAITFEYNEPNFVETGHTGTYTYAHSLSEETTDSGLRLYKDVNNQNFYCIRDWFTGIDFTFIWDGESEVEVMDQFTGYNEVYIVDAIQHMYGKSYYDAETRTFHFKVMYHTHNEDGTYAGTHAIGEETFVLDEEKTYTSYELLGTGTYTYTCVYSEPFVVSGYKLYQDTNNKDTYMIADWFYGVNFVFTWDTESNNIWIENQYTGYSYGGYDYYVMSADGYPSYYDEETRTFYFGLMYYVPEVGYLGYDYETFTLSEEQAAAMSRSRVRLSTPTLKIQKPHKMIEVSNKEVLLVK